MTGLRRILPADRKVLLLVAAPVLAIVLVLVATRAGNGTPTEPSAARSTAPTADGSGGPDPSVAAASQQGIGADASGAPVDGGTSGSGRSSGGSGVSGTDWTDGYSPSYSPEAQAVLGVDATGESTVPPSGTATTVAGATTTVPGAPTTVPGATTTTIAQPPPAVDEAVIGALLPITSVCFAALALGVLARRRRREGPVVG